MIRSPPAHTYSVWVYVLGSLTTPKPSSNRARTWNSLIFVIAYVSSFIVLLSSVVHTFLVRPFALVTTSREVLGRMPPFTHASQRLKLATVTLWLVGGTPAMYGFTCWYQ